VRIEESAIPGCFLIHPEIHADRRGTFTKIFNEDTYRDHNLNCHWAEDFYTVSRKGVLRGLHFQVPPHHHAKAVTCFRGAALDVVVDLRSGSPCYGKSAAFQLDPRDGVIVYIPFGLAHGFLALEEDTAMFYKTSTLHSPSHDKGILWNSIDLDWPVRAPVISDRDMGFPSLDEFSSPFIYEEDWNEADR